METRNAAEAVRNAATGPATDAAGALGIALGGVLAMRDDQVKEQERFLACHGLRLDPTGVEDSTAAVQALINHFSVVRWSSGTFRLSYTATDKRRG